MMIYQEQWLPEPGELFRLPETATGLDMTVRCEVPEATDAQTGEPVPPPVVLGYTATVLPPPPPVLVISALPSGVSVRADTLAGLFPILFIDCLRQGRLERVPHWDSLPADADEIIEYRPSRERQREYRLTVTARLSDGQSVNAVYSLVILQDWTAGRDRLRREIDARSNQAG